MALSFGSTAANRPTLNFGTTSTTNNASTGGLFANIGQRSTITPANLTTTKENPGGSLFQGITPRQDTTQAQTAAAAAPASASTTLQPGTTLNTSTLASGAPQIDVAHLRSTTKYDHLTPQLQQEILALDTAILNQIRQCTDVSDLLPAVVNAGSQIAPAIDFVGTKLEELETGLENDAEAIVAMRDGDVQKDAGEAKCVFRTVDRLKVPRQYQVGNTEVGGGGGLLFNNNNGGLSGWWNQPASFNRGSSVRAAAAGSSVQILDHDNNNDNDDDGDAAGGGGGGGGKTRGPKSLVELFDGRTREMDQVSAGHRKLLGEIEDFIGGLEEKVYNKERDLNERLDSSKSQMTNSGGGGEYGFQQQERDRQMQLLRFVFGEVQRNLYEVAERIGTARDGVVEVAFRR